MLEKALKQNSPKIDNYNTGFDLKNELEYQSLRIKKISRLVLLLDFVKKKIEYRGSLMLKRSIENDKPYLESFLLMSEASIVKELEKTEYAIGWGLSRYQKQNHLL
jgi:hypothetical protein